ncbi:hypothetical protein ABH991_008534 [Bradyrhizobium ottawaense]|uniref:Uncharacterized protein n=1 Tax=Bradyrhizobium ottawaense TaxID=931866 RepID=A0ABV4FHZ5_9BRAD
MGDVRIDTSQWEREYGKKPSGRRYWRFRIVAPRTTVKEYEFRTDFALTFPAACRVAMEKARQRRSDQVILLP